ncbi:GtrA family protein [Ectobacillus sp. sgz5001026]|uniref:GtrA family protein n=1 Tax=Ectobacillus sp. sgz5001026 TaxID=3242473 RepID=UPI0036D2E9BD
MNRKKEIFNYLLFGGLTTLVNIVTYYLFVTLLHVDYKVATTIAWIVSVLFAYITNKKYVFNSSHSTLGQVFKEFFYFMGFRLLSYFIDIFSMILLVGVMHINDLFAKIVANVIVVVFNYFASKYVIFKKNVEPGKKSHIS